MIDSNRELLEQATPISYKEVGGEELRLHLFQPEESAAAPMGQRSAVLFFFGSFWDQGLVSQFAPHCAYLASRGMVAATVDYRVRSQHSSTPVEAVADARSAFRWVRSNADQLGIDPEKIVGGGASGGAHLVLASSMVEGGDEPSEDLSVSGSPNAHLGFSPIVEVSKKGSGLDRFADPKLAKLYSPSTHVRKELPPTILFHGTNDRLIPYPTVERFAKRMRRKKNACDLVTFEGQEHSFFNKNVNMGHYEATLNATDQFLVEQGFLQADADSGESLV